MNNHKGFEDDLRQSGLKNTKQRAAILEALDQSDQPLAAEQVYRGLLAKGMAVNLSTVYRTLETLVDRNLATKVNITGENRTLFEYNHEVHRHHLVCLGCKKIQTIKHCPLHDYEKSLAAETNYTISSHKLDVYGYCPDCRQREEREE